MAVCKILTGVIQINCLTSFIGFLMYLNVLILSAVWRLGLHVVSATTRWIWRVIKRQWDEVTNICSSCICAEELRIVFTDCESQLKIVTSGFHIVNCPRSAVHSFLLHRSENVLPINLRIVRNLAVFLEPEWLALYVVQHHGTLWFWSLEWF